MRRVESAIAEATALIAEAEASGSPAALYELERAAAGSVAPWLPEEWRKRMWRLDLRLKPDLPGRALAPVGLPDRGAVLIWVCVEWAEGRRWSLGPEVIQPSAKQALLHGAAVACRLYPFVGPVDPEAELRFSLLGIDGRPLEPPQPITGASLGLASAMATWSLLAQEPLPQDPGFIFSALVGEEDGPRHVPLKLATRLEDKWAEVSPGAAQLMVAHGSSLPHDVPRSRVAEVAHLAEALSQVWGARWDRPWPAPRRFDAVDALEAMDREYQKGVGLDWKELAQRFETLAASLPREHQPLALGRAGACWTHLDQADRAEAMLRRAEALLDERVDPRVEIIVRNHLAVQLRDRYRLEEACEQARSGWRQARVLRAHRESFEMQSTLGQLLTVIGQTGEALPHLLSMLDHQEARRSPECARAHCYIIDALARAGRMPEAEAELQAALRHNEERNPEATARGNRAFLDYAILNGRLRHLRRAGATREEWMALSRDAAEAQEGLWKGWPGVGLEKVQDSARLHAMSEVDAAEAMEAYPSPGGSGLLAWQAAQVLLEAVLIVEDPEVQKACVRRALRAFRREWVWLQGRVELAEAEGARLRERVLELLEAEQY